jgi:hypothetical protein
MVNDVFLKYKSMHKFQLGDVLVNKRHRYEVVFKSFVGDDTKVFRTVNDFRFDTSEFEKKVK